MFKNVNKLSVDSQSVVHLHPKWLHHVTSLTLNRPTDFTRIAAKFDQIKHLVTYSNGEIVIDECVSTFDFLETFKSQNMFLSQMHHETLFKMLLTASRLEELYLVVEYVYADEQKWWLPQLFIENKPCFPLLKKLTVSDDFVQKFPTVVIALMRGCKPHSLHFCIKGEMDGWFFYEQSQNISNFVDKFAVVELDYNAAALQRLFDARLSTKKMEIIIKPNYLVETPICFSWLTQSTKPKVSTVTLHIRVPLPQWDMPQPYMPICRPNNFNAVVDYKVIYELSPIDAQTSVTDSVNVILENYKNLLTGKVVDKHFKGLFIGFVPEVEEINYEKIIYSIATKKQIDINSFTIINIFD